MSTSIEALSGVLKNFTVQTQAIRDGVEIDKGVILTEEYLLKHRAFFEDVLSKLSVYPDIYLDIIKPVDSNFTLFFYQRIVLRAIMRYKEVYVTAPRAFSKSFITILGIILQCIFIPQTRRFICAPNKNQSASIAKEKIFEIYDKFPLLRREIHGGDITQTPGNFGKDYVTLSFRNGSTFEIVGALESTRGLRKFGGLIDEVRKTVNNFEPYFYFGFFVYKTLQQQNKTHRELRT